MKDKVWEPFSRIRTIKVDVDPNIIWPIGYEPKEEYELPDSVGKFYRKARVNGRPKKAWATPAQEEYNRTHKTCPRCHGKGQIRRDGNIGCTKCKGRGAIPNEG